MKTRRVVRSEQWWDSKVPPVIAVAALAIGLRPGPARAADLVDLLLLLVSVVGVAAFGHLVNDWCDLEADARGGKPNRLSDLGQGTRSGLVAASLVVGTAPWLLLDRRTGALVALGVEVALLVGYSVPPVRLKGRAWAGAVADAGYAFAVPFLIVALELGPRRAPERAPLLLVVLAAWALALGLRGILRHQLEDVEADRSAGTGTVARSLGVRRTERLLGSVLLPVEVVLLVAVLVLAGIGWTAWVVGAFLVWRTFQAFFLWSEPIVPSALGGLRYRVEILGFQFLNDFLERWLPVAALVALAWSSPWWWLAVAAHLVLFRSAVRTFFGWDLWVLPDGLERMAFAHRARRDIRVVERKRLEGMARGPVPLADPTARRWVFVVCGPLSHLDTLGTALRHLRPVTDAEIWVLTDSTRNAAPIEWPGIDHVVDVATPSELDDHQASIWLKTSVHRHVPVGEWCYLDSDIIAVAPGVEELFDHRVGPVAFASDLTIRENSVDRFSPWAMTCACLGHGDEHSCTHLREQLVERFAVEVPGDWLHWNGGVFAFGPEAAPVLDLWHERSVASFAWPEWKTRDQGALISTVWSLGLQDLPRLSPTFNFIADLGNGDLCLDAERGWAHHPSGPWFQARMLHLYTSALEDPSWSLGRDVEAVVLRRCRVRLYRYRRAEVQASLQSAVSSGLSDARSRTQHRLNEWWWRVHDLAVLWGRRARRQPARLSPRRVWRALRVRLGLAPPVDPAEVAGPGPQRAGPGST